MFGALRHIDAVTLAERIKAVGSCRMLAPREGQRIDDAAHVQRGLANEFQLKIQEPDVELRVVNNESVGPDEIKKWRHNLSKERFVFQEPGRNPVHIFGFDWDVTFGIYEAVKVTARWNAIINLNTTDFDDAVAALGIESRRFCIENNFAQPAYSQ